MIWRGSTCPRARQEQPGAAKSSQEQPWESNITSKDKPGAPNATPANNNERQGKRSAPSLQLSTNRSAERTPPHGRSKIQIFVNRFVNKMIRFGQPPIFWILGVAPPGISQEAARSSQGQPGAARSSQGQPEEARGRQWQPGTARSSQGQPEEARGSQWQPGVARSSQGQPWASNITSKDKPGAANATPASNNERQGQQLRSLAANAARKTKRRLFG